VKSRLGALLLAIVALAATGAALGRVAAPVWTVMRAREPALRLGSAATAAGQGATLAVLGGFRALVADGVWLRLYTLWEKRDLAATDTLVHVVTAIDPRPLSFWLNGARIVAYDFTAWRIEAEGGYDTLPAPAQQRIAKEQARLALAYLDQARQFHPASADVWIEEANIELNKLHDVAAAAESYRRAWEQPHAPYYTARLYAELLRRQGRSAEALAWLKQLYPQLPSGDEGAGADVVLGRIRELERQLGVPADRAFRPEPVR
jgi:tetratricopeptide (TPR) repeat protein